MDNLVLVSVVRALDALCRGTPLVDVRQDAAHRVRLLFDGGSHSRTVVVSVLPELPWIGRPAAPPLGRRPIGPFAGALRRALHGVPLAEVRQPPGERIVQFRFADGQALVAELRPQSPNLVLLDAAGVVLATFRRSRAAGGRLAVGDAWQPPPPPRGLLNALEAPPGAVRAAIEAGLAAGEPLARVLARRLFGVGPVAAGLVAEEVMATAEDPAEALAGHLAALAAGESGAIAELPGGARGAFASAEAGALDLDLCRLLPWAPVGVPAAATARVVESDAAATAGAYYEPVERTTLFRRRAGALESLMAREAARLVEAARRAGADLDGFADPERYQRQAQALLAAGPRARRESGAWIAPDPYDEDGPEIRVPTEGGASLHETADALYARHRRACRGLERARDRARDLAERLERMQALRRSFEASPDAAGLEAYEQALRDAGVPVGLEAPTVRRRVAAGDRSVRLEGVRLFTSRDGMTILVGRNAKGNDRLTFKLSAAEDFWFHARECPGAHVVVRNDARRKRPPDATLAEAAAAAAWFSDKRGDAQVDVQWTQRRYVRRARGGAPGAVLLKRATTVRIAPALPRRR